MAERVLDAMVAEDICTVRGIIAKSRTTAGGASLYRTVLGELAEGTRNTAEQIAMLDGYEKAVAVFRAAALGLRTDMDVLTLEQRLGAQRQALAAQVALATPTAEATGTLRTEIEGLQRELTDTVFFSNRYALAFAGQVGLAALGAEQVKTENRFTFGANYDASTDRDALAAKLAEQAAADLTRVTAAQRAAGETPNDDSLRTTLTNIFTAWTNQFQWPTFREIAAKRGVGDLTLRYGNYSIRAGEFKRKYSTVEVDSRFMPVTRADVIGSTELSDVLWSSMLKLSAYDHERRQNPHRPPAVIFTYGEPGGGKTFVTHASIRSFAELCRQHGIPLKALTHSTTDYASHYQNQTANALAALAGEINAFPGIVVLYVADADNIFQSRKDPRLTAEQQQTLAVYFKMFDGTLIPKNGKFMAIMDANYIDGIDDATKSRLFDKMVELKRFTDSAHFAEYARRLITRGTDGIGITDGEWGEIGTYLLRSPLSNREIGHVLRDITDGYEVPEDLVGQPYEAHLAYRSAQLGAITRDVVIGKFEGYISTRMELERKALEAKFRDDNVRFLEHLATQRAPDTKGG